MSVLSHGNANDIAMYFIIVRTKGQVSLFHTELAPPKLRLEFQVHVDKNFYINSIEDLSNTTIS